MVTLNQYGNSLLNKTRTIYIYISI